MTLSLERETLNTPLSIFSSPRMHLNRRISERGQYTREQYGKVCTKFSHRVQFLALPAHTFVMLRPDTIIGRHIVGKMYTESHRVGRALSFVSSRRNWDSPNPSPEGECAPSPVPGEGAHSLARARGGEFQFRRGDVRCGILYIYVSTLC